MTEKQGEIAGIFVQGSGTGRAIVGDAAGGIIGALVTGRDKPGSSPLTERQIGYLSVGAGEVTLYAAKRKVLAGGFKATDDVVATIARRDVAGATFEKGKLLGKLEVTFTDGSGWTFEVPKVGNKTVDEAVAAMAAGGSEGSLPR
jgi:hypothetical protein